jgi:hypothetical protein
MTHHRGNPGSKTHKLLALSNKLYIAITSRHGYANAKRLLLLPLITSLTRIILLRLRFSILYHLLRLLQ